MFFIFFYIAASTPPFRGAERPVESVFLCGGCGLPRRACGPPGHDEERPGAPLCRGAPMCAPRRGGRTRRSALTGWTDQIYRRDGPRWPPAPPGAPTQARHVNKETQQSQILDHERQRAEKQLFFRFLPARRMGEAGKHQKLPKGNF